MGLTASAFYCLIFLLGLVSCSGEVVDDLSRQKLLLSGRTLLSEMDVVTPTTTVPVINPTYPPTTTTPVYNPFPPAISSPTTPTMTPITNPPSTPTMVTPSPPSSSSGQSWCVASQSASQTALQVALDYACGYGGADCSAIQQGGSCFNPDTLRDHASYAFNDYYQKNPIPTSCDFGGTAAVTSVDPSTSTCHYPSSSTSSSVGNTNTSTTYPSGSDVFGSVPPATTTDSTTDSALMLSSSMSLLIAITCLLMPLNFLDVFK